MLLYIYFVSRITSSTTGHFLEPMLTVIDKPREKEKGKILSQLQFIVCLSTLQLAKLYSGKKYDKLLLYLVWYKNNKFYVLLVHL